jgi:uracil-DNA glycosylase
MRNIADFVTELAKLKLPDTFNPYAETCPQHDLRGAPAIRRENLRLALEAGLSSQATSIWVGRDLGHRGGRRTGIPLSDEIRLPLLAQRLGIQGLLRKATKTSEVEERTAAEVWNMVASLREVPVFWNVFPLHPHEPEVPASNRCHRREEAKIAEHFLTELLALFKPSLILAIGNEAFGVLSKLGYPAIHIRHPSYGGQAQFREGIASAYPH